MRLSIEESNKLSQLYTEKVLVEMDVDGVMGGSETSDEDLENHDDYAPGDDRIPHLIGNVITRKGATPLKKKKGRRSGPL